MGAMFIASGTSNSRGVAILMNNNFEYKILDTRIDPEGNYLAMKITMFQTDVSLITIYGPNTDKPEFFENIINIVEDFESASIIICGDWNTVQDQNLDTKYYVRENNKRAKYKIKNMKEQFELIDPWRQYNPDKKQYTWFQRNPMKMSRLDYFLISADILALTKNTIIKPGYRSDHSIIILQLKINEYDRGKGF